ncbi:Ankyrin repeat protein [Spraguea lophii 42_110]|uniref:Palmitoyltransferase n=1 Tax=Spraguea lophii (strain 42_110) TaxID=1358809 RepID=S7XID3_SPRLO|nr:Ankyrin repeat protein [Spraguea lophii 42_110]
MESHKELLKYFKTLENYNEIYENSTYAIHWASFYGNLPLLKEIIKDSIKIEKLNMLRNNTEECLNDYSLSVINILGGKYNSNPLFFALYNKQYHIMKYLIENGCNINHINSHGNTLMHIAIYEYDILAILLLYVYDINMNIKNHNNKYLKDLIENYKGKIISRVFDKITKNKEIKTKKTRFYINKLYQNSIMFVNILLFIYCSYVIISWYTLPLILLVFFLKFFLITYQHMNIEPNNSKRRLKMIIKKLIDKNKYNVNSFCFICWIEFNNNIYKHCKYCNKCILGYHHHCSCVNNCITIKNMYSFKAYVLITLIFILYLYKKDVIGKNIMISILMIYSFMIYNLFKI